MQAKSIKVGWIIMLIIGIYRIIAGIMFIAEKNLDVGVLFFLNAVAIIGITLGSYRRAEKWSWWCLLVIVMTPPLHCTIMHGLNPWNIVGWLLFLPAIIIPAKVILGKKDT